MNASENRYRLPGVKFLIGFAALIVVIAGLKTAQTFLIPFLFSLFLAILGTPSVRRLAAWKVPKMISALVVAALMIAAVIGIGNLLFTSMNEFREALPKYSEKFIELEGMLDERLNAIGLEYTSHEVVNSIRPGAVIEFVGQTFRSVIGAVSSFVIVMIVMIFMLYEAADFRVKLRIALGGQLDEGRFEGVAADIQRYIAIKTATSAVTGVLVGTLNYVMDIEFWLLWGLIAFILNFIPFVGSIVASIPAIILGIVQFGPAAAATLALGYIVVNIGVSNFLEPILMGPRLGLSPLVVFLSLVIWGWIWGPGGMLLSVPLTMVVKIFLEHSDEFRWMAILMDNRPRQFAEQPPPSM